MYRSEFSNNSNWRANTTKQHVDGSSVAGTHKKAVQEMEHLKYLKGTNFIHLFQVSQTPTPLKLFQYGCPIRVLHIPKGLSQRWELGTPARHEAYFDHISRYTSYCLRAADQLVKTGTSARTDQRAADGSLFSDCLQAADQFVKTGISVRTDQRAGVSSEVLVQIKDQGTGFQAFPTTKTEVLAGFLSTRAQEAQLGSSHQPSSRPLAAAPTITSTNVGTEGTDEIFLF
ncbi:hypothetical protein K438DRAFT_1773953 [Mycena galopus ATCC 62051]|nr:hypothetical protein K438DRAFT_1773953 [Mycena galopus ATCC 62051]